MPFTKLINNLAIVRSTLKIWISGLAICSISACQNLTQFSELPKQDEQLNTKYTQTIYQDLVQKLQPYYGFAQSVFTLPPEKQKSKQLSSLNQALRSVGAIVCNSHTCPKHAILITDTIYKSPDSTLLRLETNDFFIERLYLGQPASQENLQSLITTQSLALSAVSLNLKNPNFKPNFRPKETKALNSPPPQKAKNISKVKTQDHSKKDQKSQDTIAFEPKYLSIKSENYTPLTLNLLAQIDQIKKQTTAWI